MDRQMNRLVALGILSRNNTSHTLPVMLLTRKLMEDKRPIIDFCLLNTHIRWRNTETPLIKDIYSILGNSHCQVMSCIDIKDVYHSIRLNQRSKEFCGILPYFSSQHYQYEVFPMGVGTSSAIWMTYVNFLLDSMLNKDKVIAIMDDLLLHSSRRRHMKLIKDLLVTMIKIGFKLSPKKSQLFMTELCYLGTLFKIKGDLLTITPLRTRIEAIEKALTTLKQCKSFCGVVNFLAIFCPELQMLLRPIYNLLKMGQTFAWTKEHSNNFEEIKGDCVSTLFSICQS